MKKFVDKLIGRLEELKTYYAEDFLQGYSCEVDCVEKYEVKKIINELAEEYNNTSTNTSTDTSTNTSTDTSTDTSSGWIPCSERLPEANQKVLTCDKDGWISVNVNMPYIGVRNDFECGYYVAWMPLPAPYKEGVTENERNSRV